MNLIIATLLLATAATTFGYVSTEEKITPVTRNLEVLECMPDHHVISLPPLSDCTNLVSVARQSASVVNISLYEVDKAMWNIPSWHCQEVVHHRWCFENFVGVQQFGASVDLHPVDLAQCASYSLKNPLPVEPTYECTWMKEVSKTFSSIKVGRSLSHVDHHTKKIWDTRSGIHHDLSAGCVKTGNHTMCWDNSTLLNPSGKVRSEFHKTGEGEFSIHPTSHGSSYLLSSDSMGVILEFQAEKTPAVVEGKNVFLQSTSGTFVTGLPKGISKVLIGQNSEIRNNELSSAIDAINFESEKSARHINAAAAQIQQVKCEMYNEDILKLKGQLHGDVSASSAFWRVFQIPDVEIVETGEMVEYKSCSWRVRELEHAVFSTENLPLVGGGFIDTITGKLVQTPGKAVRGHHQRVVRQKDGLYRIPGMEKEDPKHPWKLAKMSFTIHHESRPVRHDLMPLDRNMTGVDVSGERTKVGNNLMSSWSLGKVFAFSFGLIVPLGLCVIPIAILLVMLKRPTTRVVVAPPALHQDEVEQIRNLLQHH